MAVLNILVAITACTNWARFETVDDESPTGHPVYAFEAPTKSRRGYETGISQIFDLVTGYNKRQLAKEATYIDHAVRTILQRRQSFGHCASA